MTRTTLILRTFAHYWRRNLTASLGFAIAAVIITGSLIIGDSMRHSLELTVHYRLGSTTHSITAGDRYFTQKLGISLGKSLRSPTASALLLEGMAMVQGGAGRLNRVQVIGVDSLFAPVVGTSFPYGDLGPNQVVVSQSMATALGLSEGDYVQLTVRRASIIPLNTPFVSDADQTITRRVQVSGIAGDDDYGRFNLQVSQSPPHNAFVNIQWLNSLMELEGRANLILIAAQPQVSKNDIRSSLLQHWSIEDVNLSLGLIESINQWELRSDRVFLDEGFTHTINNILPYSQQYLTYFVNSLELNKRLTPYSFVAASNRYNLETNEIAITQWLADDLNASIGDELNVEYYHIGPLRELEVRPAKFRVKRIIPMDEVSNDHSLMPQLPGLSDAGSCSEWEAGIPINLDAIRSKDEDYWDRFRGTPKAFVALQTGKDLWSNRFGNATTIRFDALAVSESGIRDAVSKGVSPFDFGFQVNEVKAKGLHAARNAVDFAELFGGLTFFVLASGVILSVLLVILNLQQRRDQLKLFASLGYPKRLTRSILLGEGFLLSLLGASIGVAASIFYSQLVFMGLNRVWHSIVRTQLLELHVQWGTLLMGFGISMAFIFITMLLVMNRYLGVGEQVRASKRVGKSIWRGVALYISLLAGAIGLCIGGYPILTGGNLAPINFFVAGLLTLLALVALAYHAMLRFEVLPSHRISLSQLSLRSMVRNRTRSLSTLVLLALGTFVVISTGANRKLVPQGIGSPSDGTGGFLYVAETTVPIPYNLNTPDVSLALGLPSSVSFVQMGATFADDASCLNLNQVTNPRILSVNPKEFEGRFSFTKLWDTRLAHNPWELLSLPLGEVIPAIADQTVIQWGLGKQVGDTLTYTNQHGRELKLLLVAGLANSVFQGNVLISEQNFALHFPATSGTHFMLVNGNPQAAQSIGDELNLVLRDYGLSMALAPQRLAEFNTIENTYLSIFMAMGAIGLLIGTIGLAVVLARNAIERRSEVALLQAQGYRLSLIHRLFYWENGFILLVGIASGAIAAVVATLPAYLTPNSGVSLPLTILIVVILLANGWMWIVVTTRLMVKKLQVNEVLRGE